MLTVHLPCFLTSHRKQTGAPCAHSAGRRDNVQPLGQSAAPHSRCSHTHTHLRATRTHALILIPPPLNPLLPASAAAASAQLHAAAAPQAVFAGAAPASEVASAVFDQATQDAAAPETTVNLMADAPTQDTLSSSPIRGQDPTDGSLSQAAGAAASSSAEPTSSLQDYAPKLQYDVCWGS